MSSRYDQIIDMPHHVSKRHARMDRLDRAAQFAPFAALTGYEEVIAETGRLTERRIVLDEDMKTILDSRLRQALSTHRPVTITWFVADARKDGGRYMSVTSAIAKVDATRRTLTTESDTCIRLDDVIDIIEAGGDQDSITSS